MLYILWTIDGYRSLSGSRSSDLYFMTKKTFFHWSSSKTAAVISFPLVLLSAASTSGSRTVFVDVLGVSIPNSTTSLSTYLPAGPIRYLEGGNNNMISQKDHTQTLIAGCSQLDESKKNRIYKTCGHLWTNVERNDLLIKLASQPAKK